TILNAATRRCLFFIILKSFCSIICFGRKQKLDKSLRAGCVASLPALLLKRNDQGGWNLNFIQRFFNCFNYLQPFLFIRILVPFISYVALTVRQIIFNRVYKSFVETSPVKRQLFIAAFSVTISIP